MNIRKIFSATVLLAAAFAGWPPPVHSEIPAGSRLPKSAPVRGNVGRCPTGMVWIPPGQFAMGCSLGDDECAREENPAKKVKITRGFCLDLYEITQADYRKTFRKNPAEFPNCGPQCPVDNIKWSEATAYCQTRGGRLPTEAEWEYAARGGASTRFFWGNLIDGDYVQYGGNSQSSPHPVGEKKPNAYGLYDMLGNVWEWTADCYDKDWLSRMPEADPFNKGGDACGNRAVRGGSWLYFTKFLRVSNRIGLKAGNECIPVGFRCAMDGPKR